MKAIVQDRYGPPEVLALRDIDVPAIGETGVLVQVRAASVNALDWHATRGTPYLLRAAMGGLRGPKVRVRGVDLAGRVAAVGSRVTRFKVGDEVFGGGDGSFAQFTPTTEDRLAPRPPALTCEQAAAIHVAGMTSLQGLAERAQVEPGQRVLINGAGGGVGTCAVQIARWLGAHVTAVTRSESVELVRSLGADQVIDHGMTDFTRGNARYDLIFDIGGNRPFAHLRRVTVRNGIIMTVGGPAGRWLAPADRLLAAAVADRFGTQRIIPFVSANSQTSLDRLADIANAGGIRPVIERTFSLGDAPKAIRHLGEGRARGKLVIAVEKPSAD